MAISFSFNPFTGNFDQISTVALAAVGSSPNSSGASISSSQILTLQPADGSNPGLMTAGTQTLGGNKTFTGSISASNLSGTNTGDVTLGAFGSSPNSSGASLSGQILTLQPADATNPGGVSISAQTFAGDKQFSGKTGMNAAPGNGVLWAKANGTNYDSGLTLEGFGSNANRVWHLFPDSSGYFYFKNDNQTQFPIMFDNAGQVGCGTGSPTAQLTVGSPVDRVQMIVMSNSTQTNDLQRWTDTGSVTVAKVLATGAMTVLSDTHSSATASTVPYYDSGKTLVSSSVTPTELGYVSGVTSSIQTQLNAKKKTTITSVKILVGNGSNVAASVAMSNDATISNTGALTIANSAVTNAKLANMANQTIKGNVSGSSAAPSDLNATQATAMLNAMVGDSGSGGTKGLVPAPAAGDAAANKFLKADGTWATGGTTLSIGTFDSQSAVANGLVISGSSLYAQSADATHPGMVNTSTQTLAGVKTFSSAPNLSSLTASRPLKLDVSKNITATQIDLSSTNDVTNSVGIANGGTGLSAAGTDGQVLKSMNSVFINSSYYSPFINYVGNAFAETNTNGWATYSDAAQNIPVDATGGTATGLTFTRNTSSPLRGASNFKLAQTNSTNVQGKGVSFDFTINSADQAKPLVIQFDFNASSTFVASNGTTAPLNDGTTSTNAGNSDIEVFIYDVTNAALIPVSPQVITANGSGNYTFKGLFQTAPNSTSYRLALHCATTSANATGWTFGWSNVFVGPQVYVQGSVITDWQNTLTFTVNSLGTVDTANSSVWYRRVGDTMQVTGYVTCGTPTAAIASISMPSGYNINTSKMGTLASQAVGYCVAEYSSTVNVFSNSSSQQIVFYDGSTNNTVFFAEQTSSKIYTKDNGNVLFSGNPVVNFEFTVPIAGWSSSTQMSNDTDTRVVDLIAYNNAGSATANTAIAGWTTVKDSHSAFNGTTYTIPVSGDYEVDFYAATTSGTPLAQIRTGGTLYLTGVGSGVRSCASTVISGLVAGNTITVSLDTTLTLKSTTTDTVLAIRRISGPSAIASTESVNMRYYSSSSSVSGSLGTITYATKDYDSHSAYASGVYTVPTSGKYQVNAAIILSGTFALNSQTVLEIQKNSTAVTRNKSFAGGVITDSYAQASDIISCVAGDTLRVQVSCGATGPAVVSDNFANYFSLCRVGN